MQRVTRRITLSASDGLPTEFRIFAAGKNPSTKGDALFDAQAARAVMATYAQQGVDQMIDLEHESLDGAARRPDAKDARGWYKLALRNGELWAVDVRWAPDGVRRLSNKTQRYISPAFMQDEKTGRVLEMVNCALVGMPATHNAPALVAASRFGRKTSAAIATRVSVATRARIYAAAARNGMTIGEYVRGLVTLAASAASPAKPEKALNAVARALGLDSSVASPAEIKQALDDLIQLVSPDAPDGEGDGSATAETADAPRPAVPRALSKQELAGIKRLGITPQEFTVRKRNAVKRSS